VTGSLREQGVASFSEAVAERTTAPGGGAVSGLAAALAAALTAMSARFSGDDLGELADRADGLRATALHLAESDAAAYGGYVAARRSGDPQAIREALDEAVRVPLETATLAADVAGLALGLVEDGNPRLRGDAAAGLLLAAAAARAGAVLVHENLADVPADPRLATARAAVHAAGLAEAQLLGRYRGLAAGSAP
jgi:formiminotetrahydrofolate cyclodeaminase